MLLANFNRKGSQADTQNINISASTETAMSFSTSSGGDVALGSVIAGSPTTAPATGTVLSVTTNAVNGYTLAVHDNVAGSDSCLLSAGSYIPDYSGTIASPTVWSGVGLGVTLFAADTSKEAKWGTGTTYNDGLNKYAGVPQAATVAHTVTGYREIPDTSSWAFKLDVSPGQSAGNYSGTVIFTAVAVLT